MLWPCRIRRPPGFELFCQESVVAKIAFESSRFQGEGTDDTPPEIASSTIATTQLFELEKLYLLGSTSSGKTSYVFVTVTKLP